MLEGIHPVGIESLWATFRVPHARVERRAWSVTEPVAAPHATAPRGLDLLNVYYVRSDFNQRRYNLRGQAMILNTLMQHALLEPQSQLLHSTGAILLMAG